MQDHADLFRSESRTFAEILALFADGDAFSTALTPAVLCLESCGQYRDYPDTTVKPSLPEVELDFSPKAGPLVLHGQQVLASQPPMSLVTVNEDEFEEEEDYSEEDVAEQPSRPSTTNGPGFAYQQPDLAAVMEQLLASARTTTTTAVTFALPVAPDFKAARRLASDPPATRLTSDLPRAKPRENLKSKSGKGKPEQHVALVKKQSVTNAQRAIAALLQMAEASETSSTTLELPLTSDQEADDLPELETGDESTSDDESRESPTTFKVGVPKDLFDKDDAAQKAAGTAMFSIRAHARMASTTTSNPQARIEIPLTFQHWEYILRVAISLIIATVLVVLIATLSYKCRRAESAPEAPPPRVTEPSEVSGPPAPSEDIVNDVRFLRGPGVSVYKSVAQAVFSNLPEDNFGAFWNALPEGRPEKARLGNEGISALLSALRRAYNPKNGNLALFESLGAHEAQIALIYGCPIAHLLRMTYHDEKGEPAGNSSAFMELVANHASIRSTDPSVDKSAAAMIDIVLTDGTRASTQITYFQLAAAFATSTLPLSLAYIVWKAIGSGTRVHQKLLLTAGALSGGLGNYRNCRCLTGAKADKAAQYVMFGGSATEGVFVEALAVPIDPRVCDFKNMRMTHILFNVTPQEPLEEGHEVTMTYTHNGSFWHVRAQNYDTYHEKECVRFQNQAGEQVAHTPVEGREYVGMVERPGVFSAASCQFMNPYFSYTFEDHGSLPESHTAPKPPHGSKDSEEHPSKKEPDVDQKKPGRNGGRGKKSGSANPATSTGGKQRSVLNMLMACYLSSGVLGATRDRSSWAWRPSAVPDSEFLTQPQLWVNDAPAGAVNTVLETEIVDNFLMVPIRTTIENGLQKGGIAALISDLEATADDLPPAFSIVINDLAGAGTSRLAPLRAFYVEIGATVLAAPYHISGVVPNLRCYGLLAGCTPTAGTMTEDAVRGMAEALSNIQYDFSRLTTLVSFRRLAPSTSWRLALRGREHQTFAVVRSAVGGYIWLNDLSCANVTELNEDDPMPSNFLQVATLNPNHCVTTVHGRILAVSGKWAKATLSQATGLVPAIECDGMLPSSRVKPFTDGNVRGLQMLTRDVSAVAPEERPSWRLQDGTELATSPFMAIGYVGCIAECHQLSAVREDTPGAVSGEGAYYSFRQLPPRL